MKRMILMCFIFATVTTVSAQVAELYIFNPDGSAVYGPVTAVQNIGEGTIGFVRLHRIM
ncbi:MAG: hypothetical protein LBJ72_03290 [Dysgonamonadaceae bacterium]|jgi:hypothetical protein|nr:hypothetical protein [Dysgonamonadaceae bacterium]